MEMTKGTAGMHQDEVSCSSCSTQFHIMKPLEGLVYTCKSCQSQFMLRKRGSRFESFLWSEDEILKKLLEIPGQPGPSQAQRLWRKVFSNLEDEKAHMDFVQLCRKLNQLEMAREKYGHLQSYLNWTQLPKSVQEILYPAPKVISPWQERTPWILLGLGLGMILAGLVLPGYRNMFGAGVLVGLLTIVFYRQQIFEKVK
ncbi:MAG: hypothetical protein ACK5Y2_02745 [Bdellovibrionales bacterium]